VAIISALTVKLLHKNFNLERPADVKIWTVTGGLFCMHGACFIYHYIWSYFTEVLNLRNLIIASSIFQVCFVG
jgi:hypothetical protein